jgi:hypothetical protein
MRRLGRSWRWGIVALVVAVLVSAPAVVAARPVPEASLAPDQLLDRVRASSDQPYEAYVATRGGLALPDIGPLGDVASLFGKASHLRAWVAAADRWRVDRLGVTGEVDTYRDGDAVTTWDSAERRTTQLEQAAGLRLPRPADLLPPELGRRLASAVGPDDVVSAIDARRVAGQAAAGVRIVPGSAASTVAYADLWVDEASGVTLAVDVTARGGRAPALAAETLTISFGPPDVDRLTFTPPTGPGFRVRTGDRVLDIVQQVDRSSPVDLPDTLGGLERNPGTGRGIATYGRGFDAVTLVGVPTGTVPSGLSRLPASERPWGGEGIVVESSLVKAQLITAGPVSYLLAGTVDVAELDRLAAGLAGVG